MKLLTTISIFGLLIRNGCSLAIGADPTDLKQSINAAYLLPAPSRTFSIEYAAVIPEVPKGTKQLRVWLPVPEDSTVQQIRGLTFSRKAQINREPKYGNRIAYFEIADPVAPVHVKMKFICTRREVRLDLSRLATDAEDPENAYAVYKNPDLLVTIDEPIRRLAEDVAAGKTSTLSKARQIYDYVLGKMTYDKNHAGWGLGSTQHACEVGKGNCTDFHALFNSLCRAQGIASGFEIGLYLPYGDMGDEPLGGYHCWALFRVPGKSWVPVDCSEADRYPERKEFFFGGHTSNRVTLSTGRDIVLEPAQEGAPLNYFLNPYAEADGRSVTAEKSWIYRDLD